MVAPEDMIALDRWMVDRALQLQEELHEDYGNYAFLRIYQKVYNFCEATLGGFYLDIIKDRQYTTPCGRGAGSLDCADPQLYR